jgi:hypothetical protein
MGVPAAGVSEVDSDVGLEGRVKPSKTGSPPERLRDQRDASVRFLLSHLTQPLGGNHVYPARGYPGIG